jgi:hypothetical protein
MKNILRVLAVTAIMAVPLSAVEPASHDFRTSVPASGVLRLEVDMPASDLVIQNGPAETIEVFGRVTRAYRFHKEKARAQQIVDASSVRVDLKGSRAILRRQFGPGAKGRSAQGGNTQFRVTVRVPAGTHVEVHQKAGDVKVAGSFGDIDVKMRAGDVSISTPKRNVRELLATTSVGEVNTNLGDRMVSKQGVFPGRTHYLNEGGRSMVSVDLMAGEVDIVLTQ